MRRRQAMSESDRTERTLPARFKPGMAVVSLSGHDRGSLYIVIGVKTDNRLVLADGGKRNLANAKQKNIKHVRVLGQAMSSQDLAEALHQEPCERERDTFIRKLIRQWMETERAGSQDKMSSEE